jgi:hypothetical protein
MEIILNSIFITERIYSTALSLHAFRYARSLQINKQPTPKTVASTVPPYPNVFVKGAGTSPMPPIRRADMAKWRPHQA